MGKLERLILLSLKHTIVLNATYVERIKTSHVNAFNVPFVIATVPTNDI